MFENTANTCSNILSDTGTVPDDRATLELNRQSEKINRFDAEELSEMIDLSSLSGESVVAKIKGSKTGMEYARLEYVNFNLDPVVLVEYLQVNKNIRSNGVATQFRSDLIQSLSESRLIYTKVSNEKLESVVRRQGFESFCERPSDNWYVMKRA